MVKILKTLVYGTWYTLVTYFVFALLLCLAVLCIPVALILIPIGAFSFAWDPKIVVDKMPEEIIRKEKEND